MNHWFWHVADIFFVVFHTGVIFFNVFGWIWKKTRRWNLALLLLTGASWTLLGIFYGLGYCPLTDWHFDVLYKLGQTGLPNSYIHYLIERITGFHANPELVDQLTLYIFLAALVISLFANLFTRKTQVRRKKN